MRHVWHPVAALTVAMALAQPTAYAQFARQEIISFQSAKVSPTDFLNGKKGETVNLLLNWLDARGIETAGDIENRLHPLQPLINGVPGYPQLPRDLFRRFELRHPFQHFELARRQPRERGVRVLCTLHFRSPVRPHALWTR